ncbi:MAG: TIGR02556 family CRISPR-associated protein [Nitrospiraceae bacterium]|nr:TIGR02556 family CRISPR-associated protein [Nitrospiraceae bacterium]
MLSAIKDIGELASITETQRDGKVLVILLDTDKQIYSGTDIEDFDSGKIKQYLFKEGGSKGRVSSPFAQLTETKKTYEKKIEGWLKKCNDKKMGSILKEDKPFIDKVLKTLKENREAIIADITQKANEIPKKTGKFLTVKLDGKYLGEYDVFSKCLVHFAETKRKKSANTGVCSICKLSDKEVSGKTDVFRFYTIDKPGFITGGFQETLAWKNYPVCLECNTLLENGKKFLENNLRFNFVYGLNYYLIPRLLIGRSGILEEILNTLSDTSKKVSLKERIKKRITNDENEILEYLSEAKDIMTLNFLFLERPPGSSAEKIRLLIEDVFPSRIRKIFDAKDYVDSIFDEEFNFGRIRTFFSKSNEGKRESDLNKYFLEIVDSVFKGKRLDFSFLVKFYMAIIRKEFINEGYFSFRVKDALMNTAFFENLILITFEEVENMEGSIDLPPFIVPLIIRKLQHLLPLQAA